MSKRVITTLCVLALTVSLLVPMSSLGTALAAPDATPFSLTFSGGSMAALEERGGHVETGECATGEVVRGEVSQDGDGAAYKATHIPGSSDYLSVKNGVKVFFGTKLPAGVMYKISVWFYVPSAGNQDIEGKGTMIGPGLVVNDGSASSDYKYPNSESGAGKVEYDTWMNVTFDTPAFDEEIEFVNCRFYTNNASSHPEVFYIDNVEVTAAGAGAEHSIQEDIPGLRDIYKDYFMVGTTGNDKALLGTRFELIQKHFNTFTYENEMKPQYVQTQEGTFTFDTVDKMTQILKDNGFHIIGHTLAWHSQSPAWMFDSQDKARERLEKHIEEVVKHSGPDLVSIDVVNEAFSDNPPDLDDWRDALRSNVGWYTVLGADFVEIAFRKADAVRQEIGRPDLKLYYNDFNLDYEGKATNVYNMVKELNDKFQAEGSDHLLIDGIGMQAHYNQGTSADNVRASVEKFAALPGIEISVTELDITIQSSLGNPSLTPDEAKQQGTLYAELMEIYKEYAKGPANPDAGKRLIARVTFWGTTDDVSWRTDRNPLLFDKEFRAKGAYYAVAAPEQYLANDGVVDLALINQAPVATETPTAAPETLALPSPAPAPTEEPSGGGGMPMGAILGICAGVVVVTGGIVFAVKKKK